MLPFFLIFYFIFLFVVDFVIHWNETAMGLHEKNKKYASLGYQIIIIISTCRGGVALKNSLFSQLLICPLLFFFLLSSHKSEFFTTDPVA